MIPFHRIWSFRSSPVLGSMEVRLPTGGLRVVGIYMIGLLALGLGLGLGACTDSSEGPSTTSPDPEDSDPPEAVANLSVSDRSQTSITLSWNAPVNTVVLGTAIASSEYLLRFREGIHTDAWSDTDWNNATVVEDVITPAAPGTSEEMLVEGLTVDRPFSFAVRSLDENDNLSPLSNIAGAWTAAPPRGEWATLGTGLPGPVKALETYDGRLIAGGINYRTFGAYLRAWNGTAWEDLSDAEFSGGAFLSIESLAADHSDLYIGGSFRDVGGLPADNIARYDGTDWHLLAGGATGAVESIALFNGTVVIGGAFIAGGRNGGFSQWDGQRWVLVGQAPGPAIAPEALLVHNGELYAGAGVWFEGARALNGIARWTGVAWETVAGGVAGKNGHYVHAAYSSGNDLYIGGAFDTAGSTQTSGMAVLRGGNWESVGNDAAGVAEGGKELPYVHAIAELDGDLFFGGNFGVAGSHPASNIVGFDGETWYELGTGMTGEQPYVYALLAHDGKLYAGGQFQNIGSLEAPFIAVWEPN